MHPSDPPIADELDELRKLRIVQDVEILRDYLAHQCHMKSLLLDGACKLTLPREQLEKSIYAMHCKILAAVAAALLLLLNLLRKTMCTMTLMMNNL